MNLFINKVEDIYQEVNIKRAIILMISKSDDLYDLYYQLINKSHNPIIINDFSIIDYNYRLFIINDIDLLDKFDKDTYNIIFIYK
jgi:hypothetical protein